MATAGNQFTNARGQKLYTTSVLPISTPITAVLVWHHGLGEYVDRHKAAFADFAAAGIAVYGFDAHGHGKSEPSGDKARGYVESFDHLVDDAVQYINLVEEQVAAMNPRPPLFLGGNSMGGLVASHAVLRRPVGIAGLVMQSPAIDVEWNPVLRVQAVFGNALSALVPYAKLVPAVRPEDMSQDPEHVKAYLSDPMIYKGKVMARTGNELLKGFKSLQQQRSKFTLPIYVVFGTSDRCTSLQAARIHLKGVSSTDVTLKEVEGGYHELLHGPEKQQVRQGIVEWTSAHALAPPAANSSL